MNGLTDGYRLSGGVEIPCIGLGTWQASEGEEAYTAVRNALEIGYRHIDTAAGYGNEVSVGRAVRESGLAREAVFITSKLHNDFRGYENTLSAFEETMQNLQMDYIDLYLIHWPNPIKFRGHWQEANANTWKALEALHCNGRIRAIGVSNFCPRHLDALYQTAVIPPQINQIRLCPGDVQAETVRYCRERGILLEAYSPLGTGRIFDVPEMQTLAAKYERSIAQICVRWSLQNGFLPLPKSVNTARIRENGKVFDFCLSQEDMEIIAALDGCCGHARNPDETAF